MGITSVKAVLCLTRLRIANSCRFVRLKFGEVHRLELSRGLMNRGG